MQQCQEVRVVLHVYPIAQMMADSADFRLSAPVSGKALSNTLPYLPPFRQAPDLMTLSCVNCKPNSYDQRRRNIDNWGADIHIFVFCSINIF